jgi:uncharacterized membrane protein YesL
MSKIFSYDSKLMTLLNNVADIIFTNLLFLLCCIPVVTIGAARSAMHSVTAMWMDKDTAGGREFMKAFWENLRYATLPWLVMLALGAVLAWEAMLMSAYELPAEILLWAIFYLLVFVYLLTLTHVFHIPARFTSTSSQTMKSALLIGLGNMIPTAISAAPSTSRKMSRISCLVPPDDGSCLTAAASWPFTSCAICLRTCTTERKMYATKIATSKMPTQRLKAPKAMATVT